MPPSSRLAWVTNDSFGDESKDEEQGKGIGAEVETEASEQGASTDTEQRNCSLPPFFTKPKQDQGEGEHTDRHVVLL